MNLLFDLDGTLTDPFEGITKCIRYALEKLDRRLPPADQLRWCIGPPLRQSFSKLLDSIDSQLVDQALQWYRDRFSTIGLYENRVYEGIPKVLAALIRNGHTLYVATSKPAVYAQRIIAHFELQSYFRKVYGSELNGTRSDKIALITHILTCEAIAANDTVMIGDRKYDMIGAQQNGVGTIGVLWGYGARDELVSAGADKLVDTPHELIAAVGVRPNIDGH